MGKMVSKLIGVFSLIAIFFGIIIAFFVPDSVFETYETSFAQTTKTIDEGQKEEFKDLPKGVSISDWDLVLVNNDHKVENSNPQLQDIGNGYEVDKRIVKKWQELDQLAQKEGVELQVVSAFRSVAYQESVIQTNIQENIALGMSKEEATKETMKVMTRPGYSEHHTGLALDIVGKDYYNKHKDNLLVADFEKDKSAQWLAANAPKYGFILRYMKGMTNITGINFEPWHFRYVGEANAIYMTEHHLTLEEYIILLKKAGRE